VQLGFLLIPFWASVADVELRAGVPLAAAHVGGVVDRMQGSIVNRPGASWMLR
jgi:hypothetical protein